MLMVKSGKTPIFIEILKEKKNITVQNTNTGELQEFPCESKESCEVKFTEIVDQKEKEGFAQFDLENLKMKRNSDRDCDPFNNTAVRLIYNQDKIGKADIGGKINGLQDTGFRKLIASRQIQDINRLHFFVDHNMDEVQEVFESLKNAGPFDKLDTLYIEQATQQNTPENSPGVLNTKESFWRAMPKLKHMGLELIKLSSGPPMNLPNLTKLWWWTTLPDSSEVRRIFHGRFDKLETLAIDFSYMVFNTPVKWKLNDFKIIFEGKLPALKHLQLRSMGMTLQFLEELIRSGIIKQLHTLDIACNSLGDAGLSLIMNSKHEFELLKQFTCSLDEDIADHRFEEIKRSFANVQCQFIESGVWEWYEFRV